MIVAAASFPGCIMRSTAHQIEVRSRVFLGLADRGATGPPALLLFPRSPNQGIILCESLMKRARVLPRWLRG